ncbi:GNAT family N-acetyltransferase [Plantibacter flavus]|nr:GNAT family N-acetyltransferase [Plantibacter flavus]
MPASPTVAIRPYEASDESSWVRCRVLAFLTTQYYDDVWPRRPDMSAPSFGLVAVDAEGRVIGLLDVSVDADAATIDSIATYPSHQGAGIGTALLEAAVERLADEGVSSLDAWTREDPAANGWYRRNGFSEAFQYLHVHLEDGDDADGFTTPPGLSSPVRAFVHASIEREQELRERFARVYVCRQYVRKLAG